MYEYKVVSKWSGWWGGWGSEDDVAGIINEAVNEGWRLIRSESMRLFWWWFLPRPKVLFIFERQKST